MLLVAVGPIFRITRAENVLLLVAADPIFRITRAKNVAVAGPFSPFNFSD